MRCCRNPKPTTWWRMFLGVRKTRLPLFQSPPRRSRLHTFITDIVQHQVDFIYGLVDAKRVGEGLQSWHEAKAKWTADSWAFHCSCAELPTLSTGRLVPTHVRSSRHHPTHSMLYISSHLHGDFLPPFFSSLSQGHSLQYLFNENTFRTTYPFRKEDEVLEGVEPQNCWDLEVYK